MKDRTSTIGWIRTNRKVIFSERIRQLSGGRRLVMDDLRVEDAGNYTCQDMESNQSIYSVRVGVRSVPEAVAHLEVRPRTIFALLTWRQTKKNTIQDSIDHYVVSFRRRRQWSECSTTECSTMSWSTLAPVPADAHSLTVYGLKPNSTYYFRIYAVNSAGRGKSVSTVTKTKYKVEEEDQSSSLSVWTLTISVVVASIAVLLGLGISLLLLRNCNRSSRRLMNNAEASEEAMELVPHITLNPSFNIDMLEHIEPDNPMDYNQG